jgi:DNA (cytosine-5)-methyltransferase 1
LKAVDLFAGVGGLSEGARQAGATTIWAGNHWPLACEWFERNHGIRPECQDLQQANWDAVPRHDLLLAAPACQGHTAARGKERPHHDALRSTAWAVVSCVEVHRPAAAVIENVPAFAEWSLYGPWCAAMNALGYALAPMVLDAADHGVPQHRRRLFIVATRSKHPMELRLPKREYVAASNVIDFSAGRWADVERPGRSLKTLERVRCGRAEFGERFVMPYYGSGSGATGRSLARPIGTLTTRARWAIVDGNRMRMVSRHEAKRFMGLPDAYQLPDNEPEAHHLIGNGVCPQVACDLIHALRNAA